MQHHEKPQRQSRWAWVVLAPILLLAVCIGATPRARAWLGWAGQPDAPGALDSDIFLRNEPLIQQPPILSAESAGLEDSAEVIGVSVKGRHRAYLVEALAPIPDHVVNDLISDVPVTVTYCGIVNCVRVFTDRHTGQPLAVAVGGLDDRPESRGMLLRLGDDFFRQDSGQPLQDGAAPFPYPQMHFERTSWGQWRKDHPDSDVYIGPGASAE